MKEILISQKLLRQAEVIDAAQRLINDWDQPNINGMTEISTRLLKMLEISLGNLERVEGELRQYEIDNM